MLLAISLYIWYLKYHTYLEEAGALIDPWLPEPLDLCNLLDWDVLFDYCVFTFIIKRSVHSMYRSLCYTIHIIYKTLSCSQYTPCVI